MPRGVSCSSQMGQAPRHKRNDTPRAESKMAAGAFCWLAMRGVVAGERKAAVRALAGLGAPYFPWKFAAAFATP
jgi:hypothetical protein